MTSKTISLAVLLLFIVVLALVLGSDETPSPATIRIMGAEEQSAQRDGGYESLQERESVGGEERRVGGTGRDLVLRHFGNDARRAEDEYERLGISIDEMPELRDWTLCYPKLEKHMTMSSEHVEETVVSMTHWPSEVDGEFLRSRFQYTGMVDEILIGSILELVEPANLDMRAHLEVAMDELSKEITKKYRYKKFNLSPYADVLSGEPAGKELNGGSAYINGWFVSWTVTQNDCPNVDGLFQSAKQIAATRDKSVASLLSKQ